MNIKLFYDKECPFFNSYANYVELKENHDLEILNARTELKSIDELKFIRKLTLKLLNKKQQI